MSFKSYSTTHTEFTSTEAIMQCRTVIAELAVLSQTDYNEDLINEGITDTFKNLTAEIGSNSSKGLFHYFKDFSKGMGKFFVAAVKGDTKTMKALANKEVTKEDMLNILVRMDEITLGLISAPVTMIDAITGWDLVLTIKKNAHKINNKAKEFQLALKTVKTGITQLFDGAPQKKMLKAVAGIEGALPREYKQRGKF